jgi:hypothetical protein
MDNQPADVRDALLPLAHSLHSTPSSHTLILGAGVSIAAGVPSAWGVLTSLVEKVATQHEVELPDNDGGEAALAWYAEAFDEPATYEALLARLGQTQTERQRILRQFFDLDPDAEEGSSDRRPTRAHRAIATLVKSGHIRLMVTLNFDTLLEQAIREVGIEPTVVATPSDLAGLAPLHTHDALVVHLHGQYLIPTSMRNTVDELAAYNEVENAFLDRLLADYGAVLVGWSGTYDPALRDALARTRCPHFSSYWIGPGDLSPVAEQLRVLRGISPVRATADIALGALADAVAALAGASTRAPSTVPVAVATAKRQLSGQRVSIGLHDLLNSEFTRVRSIPRLDEAAVGSLPDADYSELLAEVESESEVATALVATSAFWGNKSTDDWLVAEIERSVRPLVAGGTVKVLRLPHVPALLWSAAAAIGAVAGGRWELVGRVLRGIRVEFPGGRPGAAASELVPEQFYLATPTTWLFDRLEALFIEHLGITSAGWIDAWETVEYLRMLIPFREGRAAEISTAIAELRRAAQISDEAKAEKREALVRGLSDAVSVRLTHIRVRDTSGRDLYWPLVGLRLVAEVRRDSVGHPLAADDIAGDSVESALLVLDAVNLAIARRGKDVAWRGVLGGGGNGFGWIPDYIWLDSGRPPEREI